jgi:hypothetical protein
MLPTTDAPLQVLDRARDTNASWIDVADALLALEAAASRAPDGRTWVSVAAQLSRFSENQLRRFTRTFSFVQEGEVDRPTLLERLRPFPFSQVEVLGKIWQLDRERALDLIDQAKDANSFTYLELLERYQDIRSERPGQISPIAAGKHAAQQFINACRSVLQDTKLLTAGALFPENRRTILRFVVPFEYARPHFVIRDSSLEVPTADAIDCFLISERTPYEALIKKISQIAFESTFFKNFWCLIPPSELKKDFIAACDELELANVGLLIVDAPRKSCSILRNPGCAAVPLPDRRRQLFLSSQAYKRLRALTETV